jgi:hypothetical protein
MTFDAYVFPESVAHLARLTLDAVNISTPARVYGGPHAGKMYLDAALASRDPRWVPLFEPLIADPSNQVQFVTLARAEVTPPATL